MKLYFKDTELSYSQISDLLTSHVGPSGPDTWQNGSEIIKELELESSSGYFGYVEIYNDHPASSFVRLKW